MHSCNGNTPFKLESGIQLLARLRRKPDIQKFYPVLFEDGPKHGEVIEIYGNNNVFCLITDIMLEALIPSSLGGVEAEVLLINTECSLNIDIILFILKQKLLTRVANNSELVRITEKELDKLAYDTLSHLHVMEIYSITTLYASLHELDRVLVENPNISLVMFDTLSAFYWSEQGFQLIKMDTYLKNLLKMIQKITKDYKITILYSRPEYFRSSKDIIENLEACVEQPTLERLNYQIQMLPNEDGSYMVNVRTSAKFFKKYFNIIQDQIKWL